MEFVYAVVWKRTVSYCFTIFTCDLQHQKFLWFILFNTVSCYKCFGHCFVALSTCAEACFVEESIDSFPVFNLGFCLVKFDFWSMESLEEEGDFCIFVRECLLLLMSFWLYLYFVLIFGKKFSCNQEIWALVYDEFVSVSAICVS